MKVLVVSDTHGNLDHIKYVLDSTIPHGIEAVLHCGDYVTDARLLQKFYPQVEVYYVYGNCDVGFGGENTTVVTLEEVPIYMTHGHRYGVKWGEYDELVIDAIAHEAKVAICGHSHVAHLQLLDDILVMNPGSATLPRDSSYPSYGVLELEKGKVKNATIMQITEGGIVVQHPISNGFCLDET